MKPKQAQLFLSVVLLDAIREDIQQNKKLNVQYYEALKKALYKPSAFFKGIIFPMLDVRTLSQSCVDHRIHNEVVVRLLAEGSSYCCFGRSKEQSTCASCISGIDENSRNGLYWQALFLAISPSSVSLRHIYLGPNSLFIRVLVDKKFQLPFKVVDALVFHFIRLSNTYKAKTRGDAEKLPVLWHQSLLAFVQRSGHLFIRIGRFTDPPPDMLQILPPNKKTPYWTLSAQRPTHRLGLK